MEEWCAAGSALFSDPNRDIGQCKHVTVCIGRSGDLLVAAL